MLTCFSIQLFNAVQRPTESLQQATPLCRRDSTLWSGVCPHHRHATRPTPLSNTVLARHTPATAEPPVALMNYPHPNMTTAGMQPGSASISLPPISSIDFRTQQAHHAPPEVLQPLPPAQPPRQLPPLPHQHYYNGGRVIPHQPEYVQQRAIYPGMQVASPYQLVSSRVPLPSTTDPSLIVAPARHKTKEVKRRTKTGCLTCRKRRIKVRTFRLCLCLLRG